VKYSQLSTFTPACGEGARPDRLRGVGHSAAGVFERLDAVPIQERHTARRRERR
jgi:hypothetical protein